MDEEHEDPNPYAVPAAEVEDQRGDLDAREEERSALLEVEGNVRRVGAGLVACGALVSAWTGRKLLLALDEGTNEVVAFWVLAVCGAVAGIGIGVGLWRLSPAARAPGLVLSAVLVIVALVYAWGAVLLAGFLVYVLCSAQGKQVLSEGYQELVLDTPHMRAKPIEPAWIVLFVLATVAAVAAVSVGLR